MKYKTTHNYVTIKYDCGATLSFIRIEFTDMLVPLTLFTNDVMLIRDIRFQYLIKTTLFKL